MRFLFLLVTLALVSACGGEQAPVETDATTYNIDAGRISVSGISSGAYMAGQLHVAYSGIFSGAALLGGGPYRCAGGSITQGLGPCMKGGDMALTTLAEYADEAADAGLIDALANLADDRVWIFHGAGDVIMHPDTSAAAAAFYETVATADGITMVTDVPVVHGFPTLATGAACDEFAAPYLNACDYDAAGELLAALHGPLEPREPATGELRRIEQPGAGDAEMLEHAFLYVPAACADGEACGVHVALHGCLQSSAFVADAFATGAGYNEWAEANRLLVLYPQVASSKIAPLNPNGCWDWWGYTDDNYATKAAPQMTVIVNTLNSLAGQRL